jgi:hypothetical protein
MRLAFTGGCRSHAGVIGGALSAGCGAIAGGLVAGVSTRSAAVHGDDAAATGDDASEIVGEVLDTSGNGDHDALPTLGTTAAGAGGMVSARDPGDTGGSRDGDQGNLGPSAGSRTPTGGDAAGRAAAGDSVASGSHPNGSQSSRLDGPAPSAAAQGGSGLDESGRSPRSVGGQPPPATWIGSRTGNAGSGRYRSAERGERADKADARGRTPESNVESQRRMTPPPLSCAGFPGAGGLPAGNPARQSPRA